MATEKRLIDADEAVRISKEERFMWAYDLTDLEEFLADVPTVDAVEVVRCKDCVSGQAQPYTDLLHCNVMGCCGLKPNDFCSYGERRTNG